MSDYSAWLAANPAQLVADHFGMDPGTIAGLRQRRLGIAPAHEEPLQE